jgi:PAB1-binding protein PBP1
MRNLLISVGIFLTMLIAIFLSTVYLSRICSDLIKTTDTLEEQITNEKWKDAYGSSIKLSSKWKSYCTKISIFVDHEEIDNIDHELWTLTQYTKCKNKDESLADIHVIKFFLNHITNMEKITVQNIF